MTKKNWWVIITLLMLASAATIYVADNVVGQLNRIKERKTELSMRGNWFILEKYRREHSRFPLPGFVGTAQSLRQEIPTIDDGFSSHDAWGNDLLYVCTPEGDDYFLISLGLTGSFDFSAYFFDETRKMAEDPTGNIVYGGNGVVLFHERAILHPTADDNFSDEEIDEWLGH